MRRENYRPLVSPENISCPFFPSHLSIPSLVTVPGQSAELYHSRQRRCRQIQPRPSLFCPLLATLLGLSGIWFWQKLENKGTVSTMGQIKTRHHVRTSKETFASSLFCVFLPKRHNLNPSRGNIQQTQLERHYAK